MQHQPAPKEGLLPLQAGECWARSGAALLDLSYCRYEPSTYHLYCSGSFIGISAFPGHAPPQMLTIFPLLRFAYELEKDDAAYQGLHRHRLEGALHLNMLGLRATTWAWLMGKRPYRVTADDHKGDGKRIERLTWWGDDKPQPRSAADKAWTYTMKRLMDGNGTVDRGVLKEYVKTLGSTAHVFSPRF